jgi:hypothetical protein
MDVKLRDARPLDAYGPALSAKSKRALDECLSSRVVEFCFFAGAMVVVVVVLTIQNGTGPASLH